MHYPAVPTGPIVLLLLDLETTGTDVGRCRIVEIAAAQAVDHPGLPGACFGQVVRVPDEILRANFDARTIFGFPRVPKTGLWAPFVRAWEEAWV
jgi:hypothetical protein